MALVEGLDRLRSGVAIQKVGKPNGFGEIRFGWSEFGDSDSMAGYYQRRHTRSGIKICRMRHYWPRQNPGPAEAARRANFAAGVAAWKALPDETKEMYNNTEYPVGQSGFNRYMSKWMKGQL